jgi:phosphoesterase RecJ-like protein
MVFHLNRIFARMNSADVRQMREWLSTPQRIVLIPHKNPDGDAIGASLALYHFFQAEGHHVDVISPNDFPEFLKWMPGAETVINYEKKSHQARERIGLASLIFTLDFNSLNRIGSLSDALQDLQADFIMIDHHQSPEDYARVCYSDVQMSSTCEMVYHFLASLDALDQIDHQIANCLYTGIMTDTGSFKYSATTPTTMRVVAHLMEQGAAHTEIHRHIYDTNRPERLQLLGCALQNLTILPAYRTAYITLSQEELDRYHFQKGDTEGFVNYGLSLKDVVLAAIFIENRDEGIIKISLRSQGSFSVNEFSRAHFNGGGHINAAGGRSELSLEETTKKFEGLLHGYQKELNL